MTALALLCGGLLLAVAWLWQQRLRQRALLRDVAESHRAIALRAREIVHIQHRRKQARDTARTARDAVSVSTTATQSVHKGIAGVVFAALDAFPAVREGSRVVREIHDTTADGVYDMIRLVDQIDFDDD